MPPIAPTAREDQEIDAASFAILRRIVDRETGIELPESKRALLQARLAGRLRALGLRGFTDFITRLEAADGQAERAALIAAVTTNVTSFFREEHHFTLLRSQILPPLLASLRRGGGLRLWSAACSTGEEPYSIAATLLSVCPEAASLDARILATDVDASVLEHAERAEYDPALVDALSPAHRVALFGNGAPRHIRDDLRRIVRFRHLNLNGDWPMRGPFHVIFCRNAAIYFTRDRQERLWQRFATLLAPGGWLILGHSERLTGPAAPAFHCEDITAYRKIA